VGRLVLWAALISAFLVILAIPNFGADKESFQAGLSAALEKALAAQIQVDPSSSGLGPDGERLVGVLVLVIPPAAAAAVTLITIVNLWLAARIAMVSGRLQRPWPQLCALSLPKFAPAFAGTAIAGSFLPDIAGIVSGIMAASLLIAFAVLGFAVLHAITRGIANRGLALAGTYAAVVVLGWPMVAMSLLGLADAAFNIRARFSRRNGQPDPRTEAHGG
jgi:hypothetical protein